MRNVVWRGVERDLCHGFVDRLQLDSLFVVLPALTLPARLATLLRSDVCVIETVSAMAAYTLAFGNAVAFSHLSTSDDLV